MMSREELLAIARKPDSEFIRQIINIDLCSSDMTSIVSLTRNSLSIVFEGDSVPERASLTNYSKSLIKELGVSRIRKVKIYGKERNANSPSWLAVIELGDPHPRVIEKGDGMTYSTIIPVSKKPARKLKTCPWCAEEIQRAAIVCKHCGRNVRTVPGSTTENPAGFRSALISLGLLGLSSFIAWITVVPLVTGQRVSEITPSLQSSSIQNVTLSEFYQISEGMDYEEVVSIIGTNGQVQSSSYLAGIQTIMYAWMNSDGSNMNAIFQNNKLVQKAQFGLQ